MQDTIVQFKTSSPALKATLGECREQQRVAEIAERCSFAGAEKRLQLKQQRA